MTRIRTRIRTCSVCVHIDTATHPVVGLFRLTRTASWILSDGTPQELFWNHCMRRRMGRRVRIRTSGHRSYVFNMFFPNRIPHHTSVHVAFVIDTYFKPIIDTCWVFQYVGPYPQQHITRCVMKEMDVLNHVVLTYVGQWSVIGAAGHVQRNTRLTSRLTRP